ncbi:MAG TPA: hypothetical protein VMD06_05275 [Steroidobacteraceae bacterium]|nr:hypothetical protein [Steroidobacteraceae bacterium]
MDLAETVPVVLAASAACGFAAKGRQLPAGNHPWQADIYLRVMLHLYCDGERALLASSPGALAGLAPHTGPRVRERRGHFTPPAVRRRPVSFDRIPAARPIEGRTAAFRR